MTNQQNKQTKWILWGALIVLVGALVCLGVASALWFKTSVTEGTSTLSSQGLSFAEGAAGEGASDAAISGSAPEQNDAEQSRHTSSSPDQTAQKAASEVDSDAASLDSSEDSALLRAHFIDVGQGDSEFVELPDGKTLLIDAGVEDAGPTVVDYISGRGYSRIDYVVVTHPHADHMGGMAQVLKSFDIGEIWMPDAVNTTRSFESMISVISERNIPTHKAIAGEVIADEVAGEAADETGYHLDILAPTEGFFSEDLNDYSAVVLLKYGEVSYLFTGDASYEGISAVAPGHVDVLKVSHHGSRTGTSRSLLRLLSPTYAVISYGIGNDYGHPKQRVLDMLYDAGAEVFGTGAEGTVDIVTDGQTISTSTEKTGTITAG